MKTENIIYLLLLIALIFYYFKWFYKYLNYVKDNEIFEDNDYPNFVKYFIIIIYMVVLFSISFILLLIFVKLKYTNVTISNLMVVYFDELYNSLRWLFNIQVLYSYNISEEIYFKIFFYNSLLLVLVCIRNCIAFFFLDTSNKLWRQVLFSIFITFILSVTTPILIEIYLNSKFRNDILYSRIEKNAMDFNDKIENFVDKIRDKIFTDRKSKDKDSKTIYHIKKINKFE